MRVQAVGGGRSLAFGGQAVNVLALKIGIEFFLGVSHSHDRIIPSL